MFNFEKEVKKFNNLTEEEKEKEIKRSKFTSKMIKNQETMNRNQLDIWHYCFELQVGGFFIYFNTGTTLMDGDRNLAVSNDLKISFHEIEPKYRYNEGLINIEVPCYKGCCPICDTRNVSILPETYITEMMYAMVQIAKAIRTNKLYLYNYFEYQDNIDIEDNSNFLITLLKCLEFNFEKLNKKRRGRKPNKKRRGKKIYKKRKGKNQTKKRRGK